eukprot:jgi/Mesvir1/26258/Mv01621-RA.1
MKVRGDRFISIEGAVEVEGRRYFNAADVPLPYVMEQLNLQGWKLHSSCGAGTKGFIEFRYMFVYQGRVMSSSAHGSSSVHGTPHGSSSVHGTPAHGTSAHGTSAHGASLHGTSSHGSRVHGLPQHTDPSPARGDLLPDDLGGLNASI